MEGSKAAAQAVEGREAGAPEISRAQSRPGLAGAVPLAEKTRARSPETISGKR